MEKQEVKSALSQSVRKPVLLSGIQPSGTLTIANYIGALKNWVRLQDEYDCLFILVDLHSITVRQDPKALRKRCFEFLALYLACGIDSEKSTIFIQSHVSAHAELAWILNCYTHMGELSRMTQFKDKSSQHTENINVGLFDYPVLMASDILLYQTDLVPVGADQKQHLEITRDIATRFNHHYSKIFKIPEPYIPKVGARIMSLQAPRNKMSKSDENIRAYISLLDPPDVVTGKIKRAVTDSGSEIRMDDEKPAVSNLLSIYQVLSGKSFQEIEQNFMGKGYAVLKKDLAELCNEFLKPIQRNYREISADKGEIERILKKGAVEAKWRAQRTLDKVYQKVGFIPAFREGKK